MLHEIIAEHSRVLRCRNRDSEDFYRAKNHNYGSNLKTEGEKARQAASLG